MLCQHSITTTGLRTPLWKWKNPLYQEDLYQKTLYQKVKITCHWERIKTRTYVHLTHIMNKHVNDSILPKNKVKTSPVCCKSRWHVEFAWPKHVSLSERERCGQRCAGGIWTHAQSKPLHPRLNASACILVLPRNIRSSTHSLSRLLAEKDTRQQKNTTR